MSDAEFKGAVIYLLHHQQAIEMHLTEVVCLVLTTLDECEPPSEAEYRSTLESLVDFLKETTSKLEQINDATDQLLAEQHSMN